MKQLSFRGLDVAIESTSNQGVARLTATRDGERVWVRDIRVLGRVGELQPRWYARVGGQYLLMFSDGEHSRGATSHEQKLHCIDETGAVRFSLALDTEGRAVAVGANVVAVHRRSNTRFPEAPDPLFEVVTIDPGQGTIVQRTPIPLSDEIVEAMRHERPTGFPRGTLEKHSDGYRFVGDIVLGRRSLSYTFALPG